MVLQLRSNGVRQRLDQVTVSLTIHFKVTTDLLWADGLCKGIIMPSLEVYYG